MHFSSEGANSVYRTIRVTTLFLNVTCLFICVVKIRFIIIFRITDTVGTFLDAFAKLLEVTVSIVVSVRLSVRMEQLSSHWINFGKT